MLGFTLALLASIGFGATAVIVRLGVQHMRPVTVTLISLVTGSAISFTIALAINGSDTVHVSAAAIPWFLFAGLLNFPGGRLLNFTSVQLAGVSRTSPIVGATPLFALILAVTFGGESVNTISVVGTVTIISGLALVLSQQ